MKACCLFLDPFWLAICHSWFQCALFSTMLDASDMEMLLLPMECSSIMLHCRHFLSYHIPDATDSIKLHFLFCQRKNAFSLLFTSKQRYSYGSEARWAAAWSIKICTLEHDKVKFSIWQSLPHLNDSSFCSCQCIEIHQHNALLWEKKCLFHQYCEFG